MKLQEEKSVLFYDEKCPLCINTVKFIKTFIQPKNISIEKLGEAKLEISFKERALDEMLLISTSGKHIWGFDTYRELFKRSTGALAIFFRLIYITSSIYPIRIIGRKIYLLISKSRKRCDDNCKIG